MAEGTGLENRHTGEPGIESSNLSLSVHADHADLYGSREFRLITRISTDHADDPSCVLKALMNKATFGAGNATRQPSSRAIHSIVAFE